MVAALAVIAIALAILAIVWARFEVHGADDIFAALSGGNPVVRQSKEERKRDAAVTSNRFATGFSP